MMSQPLNISDSLQACFPGIQFQSAYLVKMGAIPLAVHEPAGPTSFSHGELAAEIYSLLQKSPHAMQLFPSIEELTSAKLGLSGWMGSPYFQLERWVHARVVMSQRVQAEFFSFPFPEARWAPEEFLVSTNGFIYYASCPIRKVPVATDLGQVAREFLSKVLSGSTLWETRSLGPTPLHPRIYVLVAAGTSDSLEEMPIISTNAGDLCAVVSNEFSAQAMIQDFHSTFRIQRLSDFYFAKLQQQELSELSSELRECNVIMNTYLSKYFQRPYPYRLFTGMAGEVRKLLSRMHHVLMLMAEAEISWKKLSRRANDSIDSHFLLKHAADYFQEHLREDVGLDKNAQITAMKFAAEETSNASSAQAVLLAAFSGSMLGAILTLLIKSFLNASP